MTGKLGVAVIGCGKAGQAQLHWFARHAKCAIAALFDPLAEKGRQAAAAYNAPFLSSWQAAASYDGVDLVSLCGPESVRAEQAIFALENGKHVLCEKPFANTLDECDQMIAAAERCERMLLAYYNMRFHPVVHAVDEHIDAIAPVYAARFSYTQFRTNLSWRHRIEQGGGVLKSQGVHAIDLALRWLGPVNTVSGEMAIIHGGREVEDFALVNLRLQSGAIAEVYTAYTDRQPEEMRAQLQGMRGKLELRLNPYLPERNGVWLKQAGATRCIALRQASEIDPVYPGLLDCSGAAIKHLVDQLAAGRPSPLDGRAGRRSIEIVLAAYESQRRRTKIKLPLESFELDSLADCFPRFSPGDGPLTE
ncbi:MAG: Gfo/Idh/MocA family oxidoreductase [Chloroflexi bacterium]|nr:Gfo/Idh/MocA family oxidoreductase [Chloroflexota bacterium]